MLQVLRSALSWLRIPFGAGGDACEDDGQDIDAVLQFEQLVGELHLAALQTAVVTSGINVLSRGGHIENAADLRDLMPSAPVPAKTSLPRRVREEIGIKFTSLVPARDFFKASNDAQRDLQAFCADAEKFGAEEAAFLDVAHLDVEWHNLSTGALAAVVALEPDVRRCLPERYTRNTPILKKLLLEVIRGGHPCVNEDGEVKLPDLPQRRAAMRPNVHLPCVIEHQGQTWRAVAKDISTGGVGLSGVPGLTPQAVILVDFENGHCVAGLVVWSRGHRAGVKFDTPLKTTHPLLEASIGAPLH
jgi:hypothetical protein